MQPYIYNIWEEVYPSRIILIRPQNWCSRNEVLKNQSVHSTFLFSVPILVFQTKQHTACFPFPLLSFSVTHTLFSQTVPPFAAIPHAFILLLNANFLKHLQISSASTHLSFLLLKDNTTTNSLFHWNNWIRPTLPSTLSSNHSYQHRSQQMLIILKVGNSLYSWIFPYLERPAFYTTT